MTMLRTILIAALAAFFCTPALAVYKCMNGQRVTYTDAPCPGGTPVQVDTAPRFSDAAASRHRMVLQKEEIQRLQHARRRQEARQQKASQHAAQVAERKRKKCATLAMRTRWSTEDVAVASVRTTERAKRKARRAAELYELECVK